MKLSIVIPVLDSHVVVRRQANYLYQFLNADVELILIDDGSDPPLDENLLASFGIRLLVTNDKSRWSEHMATNIGVEEARGEYIFKTDIDHILTPETFDIAMRFDNDNVMMFFKRKEGKLDENGNLIDLGTERTPHANTFILKREWFLKVGGYNEYGEGFGPGGSYDLMQRLLRFGVGTCVSNKHVYVWPNSSITPTEDQHLFHKLRKTL